jgi:hypothetical protein
MAHYINKVTITLTDNDNPDQCLCYLTIDPPLPEGEKLEDNHQACLETAVVIMQAIQAGAVDTLDKRSLQ